MSSLPNSNTRPSLTHMLRSRTKLTSKRSSSSEVKNRKRNTSLKKSKAHMAMEFRTRMKKVCHWALVPKVPWNPLKLNSKSTYKNTIKPAQLLVARCNQWLPEK